MTVCSVYRLFVETVPLNEGNLAQNVRRFAGMHLVSIERLAEYVGVSRPTMQAIVAHDLTRRSRPKAETAIKIADAFGVTLNALYQKPVLCLQEAVAHFGQAPIARTVEPFPVELSRTERRIGIRTALD